MVEAPFRQQGGKELTVAVKGQSRSHGRLVGIFVVRQGLESYRVAADLLILSIIENELFLGCKCLSCESYEQQDHGDVHQVSAVAPAAFTQQTQQRENRGLAGAAASRYCAAVEFKGDGAGYKPAQRQRDCRVQVPNSQKMYTDRSGSGAGKGHSEIAL